MKVISVEQFEAICGLKKTAITYVQCRECKRVFVYAGKIIPAFYIDKCMDHQPSEVIARNLLAIAQGMN